MFNKFCENFNSKNSNIDISKKFTGLIRIMINFEILTKFKFFLFLVYT